MNKEALEKAIILLTDHLHVISEMESSFRTWSDVEMKIVEGLDYAALVADSARLHLYHGRSSEFLAARENHFAKEGIAVWSAGRIAPGFDYILTDEDES